MNWMQNIQKKLALIHFFLYKVYSIQIQITKYIILYQIVLSILWEGPLFDYETGL